ncbi:MAG: histidinol dehydrogenase [Bacteroidales bacterium]|nr:histidinol dehydrogenase [Bacteroidales bacterium]
MKIILNPQRSDWNMLCTRPGIDTSVLETQVKEIISSVRLEKDRALQRLSQKFDGTPAGNIKASLVEVIEAEGLISEELKRAIIAAKKNIEKFHSVQLSQEPVVEISEGIKCWRKSVAIEKVGLYIPGGSAPLFSTLLMLGIPAKLAGCNQIVVCTPAGINGKINPVILFTAKLLGISEIYKAGGAQAIAAMACGTETIPKVYKIFGPGNQYVTKAKELVQLEGTAIDMPAGPSEVLVIADKNADAEFIAADLLSQAEHGPDSQVIMLSDNQELIHKVKSEVEKQVMQLPRKEIALKALENSRYILLGDIDECIDFSNAYAPEHLIISTSDANKIADKIINAGSVFLGKYSCESAGDYASGTNHTLPTNGYARNYSGVSVDSFMKKITFQEITADGLEILGPAIEIMAEAENLSGHKNAVSIRLKSLKNG